MTASITSTTTVTTTNRGYFNSQINPDVITNVLTTILFVLYVATKGFYFTATINGEVVEFNGEEEMSNRLSLNLVPGDELVVTLHHDNNSTTKTLTFSADELGVHATCAPTGIHYTSKTESKSRKEIHSKHRPAA